MRWDTSLLVAIAETGDRGRRVLAFIRRPNSLVGYAVGLKITDPNVEYRELKCLLHAMAFVDRNRVQNEGRVHALASRSAGSADS